MGNYKMKILNKKSELAYNIEEYQELIKIEDEIEKEILSKIGEEIYKILTTRQNVLYELNVNIYVDKIILTLTSNCYNNNIEINESQIQAFKKVFYDKTENILVKIESTCNSARFIFQKA